MRLCCVTGCINIVLPRLALHYRKRTISDLHLPEQQLLGRIRRNGPPNLNLRIPLRHAIRHLDIVIQDHLRDNHLDLIGSEKPTRTSVPSVSKHQVLFICSDELVARMVSCAATTTQLVVPEAVELVAVRVERRVLVDGLGGYFDDGAGWDVLTVGEGDAFEDAAAERSCCG